AEAPEIAVPITLTAGPERGALTAEVDVGGAKSSFDRTVIAHPHLPERTILRPATLDVVPVALDRGGVSRIGYLAGSGDEVGAGLRDLGYAVEPVDVGAARSGSLARYDAVILGIRAFNTRPELFAARGALLDYVARGGRVIVQYNTSPERAPLAPIGPSPLVVGRGRVTEQDAPMTPIDPSDPVVTSPNRLDAADYAGWVQERGLYFAETWDPAYRPVFRTSDTGEEPLEGSLLLARHGEGVFVYTGLAFFRQLPAGVPGAARLLANVLAIETGK
nr:PIG-L family deacetylase [Deltaproteobacteria bacterium]